jgi:hypothetical protein
LKSVPFSDGLGCFVNGRRWVRADAGPDRFSEGGVMMSKRCRCGVETAADLVNNVRLFLFNCWR